MPSARRGLAVTLAMAAAAGCASGDATGTDAGPRGDGGANDAAAPDGAPIPRACAADAGGVACLFALHRLADDACDPAAVDAFVASIDARHGALPAWHDGRALFVTRGGPASIGGDWNGWQAGALTTRRLCESELHVATDAVPSGRHGYKLVSDGVWGLDPENAAFAFDDFAGNADGRNSVLDTYDSGLGQLVRPDLELCSAELDNCRGLTAYLPPGYHDPANAERRYPVLFVQDGQNVFDDHDCCFGHTGWELNVALDAAIGAGTIEPAIVVAADHAGAQRGAEYVGDRREAFMAFQVLQVQARAAALWRLDEARAYVGGSSFGANVALDLALTYPDVYAGVASLSGSYWVDQGTDAGLLARVAAAGKRPFAVYLDHGGFQGDDSDSYAANTAMRDALVTAGWQREDAPACAATPDTLCYLHAEGAAHDELAWKARAPGVLAYFFAAP